jgi:hypothetical protein
MGYASFISRCKRIYPVLACLLPLLASSPSSATADDEASTLDGAEAEFESLEKRIVVTGNIWWKYRFGDYVVKALGRETRKFDRQSDVSTLKRVYEVVAPTGAKAKIKKERKNFWGVEYPDASLGVLLLDSALESAWGWSLVDDNPDPILLKYIVSATITLADTPGETWQLAAEQLSIPTSRELGSQSEWGHGTLTNGVRTLEYVYRGASPWNEEECLEMIMARDRDKLTQQCHLKVSEIKEDGELLAWNGNYGCSQNNYMDQYCFRVGLDGNTKLLLLAMFASMIP